MWLQKTAGVMQRKGVEGEKLLSKVKEQGNGEKRDRREEMKIR